jgi:hypothetical protein
MVTALERGDIIDGLRELVSELLAAGEIAGIRLVGGAALALLAEGEPRSPSPLPPVDI